LQLDLSILRGRAGPKKARLFWAKKIPNMTVPLGKLGLFFGPGLGRPRILQCKIAKSSISGRARAKKVFLGNEICAQALSTKVRGQAKTRRARAGLGRAQFAQVYLQ